MAGLPGVSKRNRRGGQDAEAVGAPQVRQAGVFRLRTHGGARLPRSTSGKFVICRALSTVTTVVVELYRLRCPDCGIKAEKIAQLPSKAPFSKRFEDAVGEACESAAARRVAKQFERSGNHGAVHRFTISGTLGGPATETGAAATGSG